MILPQITRPHVGPGDEEGDLAVYGLQQDLVDCEMEPLRIIAYIDSKSRNRCCSRRQAAGAR